MKGILGDLGVMRISLKVDAKRVKQHPYRLNPRYKEKVRHGLDKMIAVGIIEPVEDLVNKPVLGEKTFKVGDLVLLYESKFVKFPGKFCMHWLGPYQVKHVTSGSAV